jgi:arylsulfatase A-like enzyme
MYATTCELAGVEIPKSVNFPSLASLLRGGNHPVHDAVFSYYRDFQRMVRTKTHKLIVYPQIQRIQICDLEKDPWEMHDLSGDLDIATVKEDLMLRLLRFQKELGDPLSLGKILGDPPRD